MAKGLLRTWRFELRSMSLHAVRPKILGFISEDVSAWLVALFVLVVGGVLTGLLAWSTLNLFHQQLRQRFQLLASERYSRIEERFEDQEQRLDGLRLFFANSDSVSRAEFDGYTQPLLLRTQAYSYAERVTGEQRAAFDALRKSYPLRREIDGLQVRIDGDAPVLRKIVAALGATAL